MYTPDMNLKETCEKFYDLLDISSYQDISLNGLQIESSNKEIRKIAFAVDACMDTICRAVDDGADMLFVHHGLFWGRPVAIADNHYQRVKKCIGSDMALFACHIPLDAHPLYGNNAQMALRLGMTSYDPFGEFMGKSIGFKGSLPFPMTAMEIARLLGFDREGGLKVVSFGKDMIGTVGIISGGASGDVVSAVEEGLDLFITGELRHEDYHFVKEHNMNMIAGGHYRSEVFGVQSLMRYVKGEWGIESFFVDSETGL